MISKALKGFGSFFVGEEDVSEPEIEKPPKAAAAPAPPPVVAVATAAVRPVAALNATFEAQFTRAIRAAKTPALTALLDAEETLADTIEDGATRYRAALKLTLKQFPGEQLLADFETCDAVLASQDAEFQKELTSQIGRRVNSKRQAAEASRAAVAKKREELQRIQSEIPGLEAQAEADERAAVEEQAKIDGTKASYEATMTAFRARLESQKQRIQAHGKV